MITVTDIFAGAGGSTTGMLDVPGVKVVMAANHWQVAVDVHQDNHPTTDHACVDLHMEDPRNFPRTDMLWASPECTKWTIANSKARELSVAMGGDPTLFDDVPEELESSDEDEITRSRLLMFDVLRFIEWHKYRAVVVENVVDIATRPMYAAAWAAWRRGLDKLGYAYRIVSLNSMHAQLRGRPAPQSRDRLYVVCWPKGEKPFDIDKVLRPMAWCGPCDKAVESRQAWKPGRTVGKYRQQYIYVCSDCHRAVEPGWVPASEAIDWTLPAERIGDRAKPLAPKTMARIKEGIRRYGRQPMLQRHNGNRVGESWPMTPTTEVMRTLLTAGHQSLVQPVIVEAGGNQYDSHDPRHPRHGQPGAYSRTWPITEPLRTLHTSMTKGLLIPVEGREGKRATSVDAPGRTQTTRNETGLLVPYYSASESAKPTEYPVGTLTTVDRYGLLLDDHALVTLRGTNRPKLTSEPLDTVAANGNHHGLISITDDDVMNCRFRMLQPHEIALGMAFPADYRWDGVKSGRTRTKLAGNAVTPPASRDLITVIAERLAA